MADEGAQLGIQQEINKVLQERQAIMAASAKQLQDQTQIAMQLCAALKCESLDGMVEKLETMQGSLNDAADAAEKPKNSLESVGDAASGLADKLDASKVAAVGAGVGLISGFKNAAGMLAGVGKGITGIIGSLGKVGKTILATPFKLMSGLVGMAQSGGGGPSPIREELEAMRGTFGDLASNEGKAVASSLGQVQDQMGDLGGTGLSMAQVYGHGPGGVAAAMKDVHELATAIGPGLSGMTEMFQKSAVELSMYRKGLGMTADAQAMMLKQASAAGKDPVDEMNKFASMAINMGEQFGVSAKTVGKSMSDMASDVANFGQLSVKELGKAAIYTEKLGIKTKELQGVISKFDNFEDAAKGAGEMAQAFGMNVDAMELMNAQNPAERLSMLQKSFKETGKSVEDMSRQELKMLASQSGLSEEAAKLAFSQKGMSMSYDDISKGGDKAEKKQLSQAEAMDKLAGSIQKMTKGGGGGGIKGFLDSFLSGFGDGIKKSKEFRKMMKNIRQSLKVVFKAGREVGKLFVELFPGVKQLMGGLADLFDPKKFKVLMKDVVGVFKDFFKNLSKDPVKATEEFIKKIKEKFASFFGKQGGAAKDVKEGGSKILKALGGIFTGLLSVALKGLTNLIKNITEKIKNPPGLNAGANEGMASFGATLVKALKGLVPPLLKALVEMGKAIFIKFKPQIIKIGTALLVASLTKMFLVAALSAAKGAIMGKVGAIVGKAFGKMFGSVAKNPAALKGASTMGKGMAKGGGMGKGVGGLIKGFAGIKIGDIIKAAIKLSLIALSFIPVVITFAMAAIQAYKVMKKENPLKIAAGMIALGISIAATKVMYEAGASLSPGSVGKATVGLIAGAAMIVVGAYAFSEALSMIAPQFAGINWKGVAVGMIGLAIGAGASLGMAAAGAAINPQMAAMAVIGLLAGSVLIMVGGFAFSNALKVIAPMFEGINWKGVAIAMGGLAIAAIAAVGMAYAGALIAPVALMGSAGLVVGAIMLSVGAKMFAWALGGAAEAMAPIDMKTAALNMLLLAGVAGATLIMALASAAMLVPAALGIPGAALGGVFLKVVANSFGPALLAAADALANVDMKTAAMNMGMMAITIVASAVMAAAAGAGLAMFILGMIGIKPAGAFLGMVVDNLEEPLQAFGAMPLDYGGITNNAKALAITLGAMGLTALAAVLLVPFSLPFIGGWLMKKGISLIADFMGLIGDKLAGPLGAFAAMPIPDSGNLGKKVDLINAAIEGVGTIGDVAIGLAMIDTAAVEEGGQQGGTINAITNFISVLLGSITSFVTSVVELAKSVPSDQVSSVQAISGILTALGGLFKAFSPSDEAMKAVSEASSSWGGNEVGLMNAIADQQKQAMQAAVPLFHAAGAFISQIVSAVDGVDVSGAGPVIDAIPKILEAIGGLMKSMSPSEAEMAAVSEAADSWGGDEVGLMNAINERMVMGIQAMIPLIQTIGAEMGKLISNHLAPMISIIGSMDVDPKALEAVAKIIGALMQAMTGMMNTVGPIIEMMSSSVDTGWFAPSRTSQMDELMGSFSGMMGSLTTSFTDMLPKITGFVESVVKIAQGIKDPEKTAKGMEIITKAVQLLGGIIDPMFKAWEAVYNFGKDRDTSWQEDIDFMFGSDGFLMQLVGGVGAGLKKLINDHINKIDIKDPEGMGKKLAVIETAMNILGKIIDPMMKAWDAVMKFGKGRGTAWSEDIDFMFGVPDGFLMKLAVGVGEGLKTLMSKLLEATAGITDPAVAEKKMNIIALGMEAAGNLLKMMGDAWKTIEKYGKDKSTSWSEDIAFFFHPTDGLIVKVASGMGAGIKALMTAVLAATAGIANPAKAEKQVGVLAKIIEVAATFASAIESMGAMAVPGKGKGKQVVDVVAMVGSLTGALVTNMPLLVNGLLDVIKGSGSGVTTLYKYRHSIKTLGDLMASVGQFATAIEAMQGLGGGKAGGAEKVLTAMGQLFDPSSGAATTALTNIINSMTTLPLDKLPKEAGPRLKNIVEVISAMDGLTAKKVTTITETIEEVKSLLGSIGDDEIRGVVNLSNVLAKPGKQTLTLKTVTPHIKATFVVNIDSKKLGEAVAAEGGVVAAGDGSK